MVVKLKSPASIKPGFHLQDECPVIGFGKGECNKCVVVVGGAGKAGQTGKKATSSTGAKKSPAQE